MDKCKYGLQLGLGIVLLLLSAHTDAYDPNANITIKWDVISWRPDGYLAVVSLNNYQQHRHIQPLGWSLSWTWAKNEVIWAMVGAKATEQGDCSRFKGNIPCSCKKNPTIVNLPTKAVASFQISVGSAGTSNTTVKFPKNFTLKTPGSGYTCGPAKKVKLSQFLSKSGRRFTEAFMTWNVTCT